MSDRSVDITNSVVRVGTLLALVLQSVFIGRWSQGIEDHQARQDDALAAQQKVQIQQAADIQVCKEHYGEFLVFKDQVKGRIWGVRSLPYREKWSQENQ